MIVRFLGVRSHLHRIQVIECSVCVCLVLTFIDVQSFYSTFRSVVLRMILLHSISFLNRMLPSLGRNQDAR